MGDERRASGRGWGSSKVVRRERKLISRRQDAQDGAARVLKISVRGRTKKRCSGCDAGLTSHPEWRFAFWASCASDACDAQDAGYNFC